MLSCGELCPLHQDHVGITKIDFVLPISVEVLLYPIELQLVSVAPGRAATPAQRLAARITRKAQQGKRANKGNGLKGYKHPQSLPWLIITKANSRHSTEFHV